MTECEVCGNQIQEVNLIEIKISEESVGHVTFFVHTRCIPLMGVKSRRLLEELRKQGE